MRALSRKIRILKDRAGIKVVEGKVFSWHLARCLTSRVGTEYDLSSTALKKMIGQSTGVFGKYTKRAKVRKTPEKLAKHMRMEPEKESKGERNLEEIVERVGIAMAKKLTKDAIEQLREEGLLGLQTQELDPMKDWKEIIQNYIVFDEIIPPTPNRPRKKKKRRLNFNPSLPFFI